MLKNLKALFIVEEEPRKPVETDRDEKVQPAAPPRPAGEVGPGKASEKFIEILFKAMEEANVEGFDYLEFKRSLQSLNQVAMDEPTRFQSAFAMARTMGADAGRLVQTARHYVEVLQKEEEKFGLAAAKQKEVQVGAKQTEIQNLEQTVAAKEAKIRELMQEIEAHGRQIEALRQEVSEATVKVESTRNDFTASYNFLVKQIESDIEKMQQYLK